MPETLEISEIYKGFQTKDFEGEGLRENWNIPKEQANIQKSGILLKYNLYRILYRLFKKNFQHFLFNICYYIFTSRFSKYSLQTIVVENNILRYYLFT